MGTVEFTPGQHDKEAITAHVIWMTTGLSCDGDSVAMTSATSPSLEDIILGVIPGMPKVVVHNPVLAYENGMEFMEAWFDAERGELDPFVLVMEGSVPNEQINGEGHWAAMGVDPATGQPITTNEWIDRLAPKAAAVVALGTCATYGGIPAMKNNPTGAMGLPDYLGWSWKSTAGIPIVCIPGCPTQPDNTTETLIYLVLQLAGMAPMIELDEALRPDVALRAHRPRELQPGRLLRGGRLRHRVRLRPPLPGEARLQGAGGEVQRARCAGGRAASAGAPTSAASAWPARCPASRTSTCRSWRRTPTRSSPRTRRASPTARCCATSATATSRKKYDKEPAWRTPGRSLQSGYTARW